MKFEKIKQYSNLLNEYTELRIQENSNTFISSINGNIVGNSKSSSSGVSARVFKEGFWGFASNPTLTDDTVEKIIAEAAENAEFLAKKGTKKNNPLPKTKAESVKSFATEKKRKTQAELIEFVTKIDNYIIKNYPDLTSRKIYLSNLDMEKNLITSDGSYSYSLIPRAIIYVVLSTVKDNSPVELSEVIGDRGQFEDVFVNTDQIFEKIDETYKHLMNKTEAVFAKPGIKEVILDSELAGILAHEAIGHTTEADLVLGGSVAGENLEKKVASDLITLVDFANTYKNEICPVPVFVDDEGTQSEDTVIIENGVLKNFMHNKETAAHFNTKPTGNARAYAFSDEPLIRMRNTAILPGKSKLEEMIASIEDGYYLIKPSNGQADSTSEFMFGVTLGYEIKNGIIGKAVKDTTISGIAFDVLKSVTMVSDDMSWQCSGMCGKKQSIPVGMGGPAIKCKINIGGK